MCVCINMHHKFRMNLLLDKSNAHSRQKSDMNQMCKKQLTSGIAHCEWKLSHPVFKVSWVKG